MDPEDLNFNMIQALQGLTAAVGAIEDLARNMPKDLETAVNKGLGTMQAPPFDPNKIDLEKMFEDLNKASKSLKVDTNPEDPFRLTGTERFDPSLILTMAMEKNFVEFARGFTGFNKELAATLKDFEANIKKDIRERFGPEGDKEADDKFDEFINSEEARDEIKARMDDLRDRAQRSENNRLIDLMGGAFRIPIKHFSDYVLKVLRQASEQNKESLKFNKTFSEAVVHAGTKIDGMPGSLADRMETLFDFEKQGLDQVGSATLQLAARMKMTGQNSLALITLNKKLIKQGGLSLDQNELLNEHIDNLSKSGQITADLIVGSIDKLNQSLDVLFIGDATKPVTDAIGELTKRFPSLSEEIGDFAEMFAQADIGQANILQSMQGLQDFTSGQIQTADQFQALIENVAKASQSFTRGIESNQIQGKRAMLDVVGDLGLAGERLSKSMDEFVPNMQEAGTVASRLFSNLANAVNTVLAPFEEVLTNVMTSFQRIGEVLIAFDKKMEDWGFSILKISNLMGVVLVRTILKTTTSMNLLGKMGVLKAQGAMRDMIQGLGSKLGTSLGLAAKNGARVFFAGALRLLMGPLGIGLLIWQGIKFWSDSQKKEKEAELIATAKNTAELVKLTRNKEREEFGVSRFERLTQKLLQDSLFNNAAQEALLSKVGELVSAAEQTAAAVTAPTTIVAPRAVR
jgi:hypothetical protein